MVQPADFGKLHDVPGRGELDRPEVGCVLVEREVCARLMVVSEMAGRDAEVSLAENEYVIQALAPDRADEPLREGILPRAVRRRENLLGAHALPAEPKASGGHGEEVDGDQVADVVGEERLPKAMSRC
jgi:hypothetical protein